MSGVGSKMDFGLQKNTILSGKTSQYLVEDLIARGGYGHVIKCKKVDTDEMVAIKMVKREQYASGVNEMKIFKALGQLKGGSLNIVRFLEHFEHNNQFCLAFEMLDINLFEFFKLNYSLPLPVSEIRVITQQLLVALKVLKEAGVTHRDIKCDNIMVVDRMAQPLRVKLIDFGLSTRTYNMRNFVFKQPLSYRSPDVILDFPLDEAIDMWGLGCVLSFLFLGRHLFPSRSEYETLSVMVKLLGQPHDTLLTIGNATDRFFKCVQGEFTYTWMLKSIAEFNSESDELVELQSGVHSALTSLDDLKTKRPEPKDPFEKADLVAFVNLLKKMLSMSPARRITPIDALNHEFITMSHLSAATNSPYVTESQKKMAKHAEAEREEGDIMPSGTSQLQAEEESFDSHSSKADHNTKAQIRNQDSVKRACRKGNLRTTVEMKEQKRAAPVRTVGAGRSQVAGKPGHRSEATTTAAQKTEPSVSASKKTAIPSNAVRNNKNKSNNCNSLKPKPRCEGGFCDTESTSSASSTPENSHRCPYNNRNGSDIAESAPSTDVICDTDDTNQAESEISTSKTREEAAVAERDPEEILQKIFEAFRAKQEAISKSSLISTDICDPKTEIPTSPSKKSTNVMETPANEGGNTTQAGKVGKSVKVTIIINTTLPRLDGLANKIEELPTSVAVKENHDDNVRNSVKKSEVFKINAAVTVTNKRAPLLPGNQRSVPGTCSYSTKHRHSSLTIPNCSGSVNPTVQCTMNRSEYCQTEDPVHLVKVKTRHTYVRKMKTFFTGIFKHEN